MNIVLWIVQILVGLLFILSGVMKFVMPYSEMIKDAPYAFPHWFLLFIGACELLGGIGLIVPWLTGIKPSLTPLAASLLVVIMIGAVVFSAFTPTPALAVIPVIVGLLCVFIAWGRKSQA
ncbi:DoxX family protein [soil metagenome]